MTAVHAVRVAAVIRAQVASGVLRPGTALPVARLMSEHGVSKRTIGVVLRNLANDGTVSQQHSRAPYRVVLPRAARAAS